MHANALKTFENYNAELIYSRMAEYICRAEKAKEKAGE
jgi:hypothetical protein